MAQLPKYAQFEHERRFLIATCPDLAAMDFRFIEDLYIAESRLRLRSITHSNGTEAELKLCKKYPTGDLLSGPIVNVYLAANEYTVLSQLPGMRLRKKRYRLDVSAKAFVLDVFEDHLSGLMLAEIEAVSVSELQSIEIPDWMGREITFDPFFRGANLSTASASDLDTKMKSLGVKPPWQDTIARFC